MELVKFRSLTIDYGTTRAIENIDLSIDSGDFIGVIGPNGGGKTTLVKALLGIIKPLSGTIEYSTKGLKIGYLPQQKTIDERFPATVLDVVLSGLQGKNSWRRPSKNEILYANTLLSENGIDHLRNRLIGELSGGQLQRVLLCRAIISRPQLLVLDEPTTYVDQKFERGFYDLLVELNKQMAIVIVSHDMGTICAYVRSIACVNRTLHYHPTANLTPELLSHYDCPIQIVAHGEVAHTILHRHDD